MAEYFKMSTTERPNKRRRIEFENTITVKVKNKQFHVPERLICDRSTCFKKACSEKWRKGGKKAFRLLDWEPEEFAIYLHVLHMNAAPLGEEGSEGLGELDGLFNLYIDSTRIGDVQSANFVMDEIAAGLQATSDPYKAQIAAVTKNYNWHLDASGLNALVDILAEYVATRMSRESFMSNFQDPAFADAQHFFFKVTCFALNQSGDRSNLHSFMGKEKTEWHVEKAREQGSKMIEIE